MQNVYEQVSKNKRRSFLIIALFVVFVTGAIFLISQSLSYGWGGTIFAFLFTIGSSLITYFWGDRLVLALNGAHKINKREEFDLFTVAENISQVARIPTPEIYVSEDPAPNAFATGRNPDHGVICVTRGLLNQLDRTELAAVVGHEISHIKHRDTLLFVIVSILIGSLVLLSRLLRFSGLRGRDRKKGGNMLAIVGLVLAILSPIIGQLIKLAISRQREFFADAESAKLTRQPGGLIKALKKIAQSNTRSRFATQATAHFYIDNPFRHANKLSGLASLFNTHPPIEKRINKLEKML